LFNGQHFEIQEINGDLITLSTRKMNKNTKLKDPRVFKKTDIAKYFCPAYAFTTYKAEGQTLDQPYTIWEFDDMHYKTRYTALTRATDCKNITINTEPVDVLTKFNTGKTARIYMMQNKFCNDNILRNSKQRYIGQTVRTIEERFEEHKNCAADTQRNQTALYNYMKNHDMKIKLIYEFDYININHINKVETYFIQLHDTIRRGLNQRLSVGSFWS
jgi:hypothetical protein